MLWSSITDSLVKAFVILLVMFSQRLELQCFELNPRSWIVVMSNYCFHRCAMNRNAICHHNVQYDCKLCFFTVLFEFFFSGLSIVLMLTRYRSRRKTGSWRSKTWSWGSRKKKSREFSDKPMFSSIKSLLVSSRVLLQTAFKDNVFIFKCTSSYPIIKTNPFSPRYLHSDPLRDLALQSSISGTKRSPKPS